MAYKPMSFLVRPAVRAATDGVRARLSDLSPLGLLIDEGSPLESDCYRESLSATRQSA